MTNITRRRALATTLGLSAAGILPALHAQGTDNWPSRGLRIINTTAAGGGSDLIARLFAQHLGTALGQPVVVEAQGGASGMIASAAVAKAPGDGYTLLMTHAALVQNEVLQPNKPYTLAQLTPLAMVVQNPIAFAIRGDLKANTLAEFIAVVKADPKAHSYASYGTGSSGHVLGEILKQSAGIDIPHVAYKGEAPAVADLVAGHVSASWGGIGTLTRFAANGKIKVVAVTGNQRMVGYPDVPTFIESGYPDVNLTAFGGLLAPAGTPRAITDRLTAEILRIGRLPDVQARLVELGYVPVSLNGEQFSAYLQTDIARWKKAVRDNHIKLD
jgi:tripartite-type tricarboxylate transporter receptor subunit TctC